ncbi:MAG: amidohydrolase family protein, partial [Clostridia bacterium]|nr:amidohydrolase family protein [Clostridia bacterium]
MKNEKILLRGGRVILGDRIAEGLDVAIADGKILSIAKTAGLPAESDWKVVDAAGQYVSPGFIDLHTHGGGGHDFMDGTREAFLGAAAMHARHGTTAMCPTTLSGDPDETRTVCQVYRDAKAAGPD